MTSPLTILDALRAQRSAHNAQIANASEHLAAIRAACPALMTLSEHWLYLRLVMTCARVDGSQVEPIRDVTYVVWPDGIEEPSHLPFGHYQRYGYGPDEPWNPVYAGQCSDLYQPVPDELRCRENGAW